MIEKYFNDAVIGNKKITASFTKTGEMIRLFYGYADYKQFLEIFHTGIKVNDSAIIYLHSDVNNTYNQKYIENTNILNTEIFNSYFNIRINQTDFAIFNEDVIVKKYTIKNENTKDLSINFLAYSKLLTNLNNDTCGFVKNNALLQYNHDFTVCTFSDKDLLSRQVNNSVNSFKSGVIGGKDYIGMSPDSAISYDLSTIKPGEEKTINIFININKNKDCNILNDFDDEIERIKKFDVNNLQEETANYWRNYLKEHDTLNIDTKPVSQKVKDIYNRTILLYPILINEKTGGISAGIEIDEGKTKSGRYSYCWPRDAVFITEALDVVGMSDIAEKFYSVFCKMTQNKDGRWEQRFYTDGRLAPSWGYQIDETASVVFGAYAHYKSCKNVEFLKDNFDMLQKAIDYLKLYVNDLLNKENKIEVSYDLWEMFEGETLYSVSSIYAAFSAMLRIYGILEINDDRTEELTNMASKVKDYCINTFFDENKNSFVRNLIDRRIDISMIGAVVPFCMLDCKDEKVLGTIEKINSTLRTYTGGYIRFEGDHYVGGYNPWPIATLWMAWYYLEAGDYPKAVECFNFVTNSASELSFLGEQVDNRKMKPAWVIGLTWSHSMYILILEKLLKKGIIY